MNKTNLSHWHVSIKIFMAMKAAIKTGLSQYVMNRKGEPFLKVVYSRGVANAFTFWSKQQKNVTELVLSVIRSCEV